MLVLMIWKGASLPAVSMISNQPFLAAVQHSGRSDVSILSLWRVARFRYVGPPLAREGHLDREVYGHPRESGDLVSVAY